MRDHPFLRPPRVRHVIHRPSQSSAERFPEHRSAGFADGRQLLECPVIRMALPQLFHQETVRQHDEVHMPGLALTITELTVPHAQLLLAIPMKGFRACPTMAVHPYHTTDFPAHPVGHQDNARRRGIAFRPEDHNPNFMLHVGQPQRTGKIPLPPVPLAKWFAQRWGNGSCQGVGLEQAPAIDQVAVELEGADIATRLPVR